MQDLNHRLHVIKILLPVERELGRERVQRPEIHVGRTVPHHETLVITIGRYGSIIVVRFRFIVIVNQCAKFFDPLLWTMSRGFEHRKHTDLAEFCPNGILDILCPTLPYN